MTLEQYKDKVSDGLLYRMAQEVYEHDRIYVPESRTEEFWLIDLKNCLVGGGLSDRPYKVLLRGYSIEIRIEGKWTAVVYFRQGRILVGKYSIVTDCFERAVEDLRFLTSLITKYADEYSLQMASASIEIHKDKMIRKICESTLFSSVGEMLKGRGMTCTFRPLQEAISLNVHSGRTIVKTFVVPYDDLQGALSDIKKYISHNFPVIEVQEESAAAASR